MEHLVWTEINLRWSDILQALREKLPVNECHMFDDDGNLVQSNRPMIESIICDKVDRSPRLFYYLVATGVVSIPEANFAVKPLEGGGREIIIKGHSGIGFTTGGKHERSRPAS